MSALQIYSQDKENAGARSKGNRLPLGSGSNFNRIKSFQESNTPAFVTPRKALGNILNQTPHNLKSGGLALKPVSNIKPSLNLQKQSVKSKRHVSFKNNNIQDKENVNHKKPMKVKAPVLMQIDNKQRELEIDEVDHMSIPPQIKDNRVPPPEERVSNYLEKIISWRPPCLFGIPPLSDDDDDDLDGPVSRQDIFDNLDDLTKLDTAGLGHLDDKLFDDIPDILEVDIPYIDETLPALDLPSPSPGLDDSINNISSHLGVLQLNDSVF